MNESVVNTEVCRLFVIPSYTTNTTNELFTVTAIVNCVLNSAIALSALLTNIAILLAFGREPNLRSNANFLLAWLALTDVLVGAVVQPLNIVLHIAVLQGKYFCDVTAAFDATKFLTSMMSVVTALLISVDRCLTVSLPFKYAILVTTKRITIVLISCWGFWTVIVASWTLGVAGAILQLSCIVLLILTFVILAGIYTKMAQLAQRHRNQIASQSRATQSKMITETKQHKAIKTAMYVIGAMVVCYLPIMVVVIIDMLVVMQEEVRYVTVSLAETLVFLNSSLNPAIYCLRSQEVRQAVLRLVIKKGRGQSFRSNYASATTGYPLQPIRSGDISPSQQKSVESTTGKQQHQQQEAG
ncbi:predicted protein [Nematostella vectensis]|uniref:G-protein coupled receptors family 1 profile domain-containing protein n=1 Tax=Nematostella vectensis TaxID=45351 RepID=A7RFU8_NEMVE|nr:trace amine-associated receptor 4 [Nematostella vectensis]EDO49781.1 predicted protein [Nematostella vectensis]|eukprot:XP_001641844.1 predicted protein [Nematostella vectensis]